MGESKVELLMKIVKHSKWNHLLLAAVEFTVPAILQSGCNQLSFKHKYMRVMKEGILGIKNKPTTFTLLEEDFKVDGVSFSSEILMAALCK